MTGHLEGQLVSDESRVLPRLTAERCFCLLAKAHWAHASPEIFAAVADTSIIKTILNAMKVTGLRSKLVMRKDVSRLVSLGSAYPVIVETQDHCWVVITGYKNDASRGVALTIIDPKISETDEITVDLYEFYPRWTGRLILCKKPYYITTAAVAFGFEWFVTALLPHLHLLRDVGFMALALTMITFATPMLFQTMIDMVIPHHNTITLQSITIIFIILGVFEGLFTYIRETLAMFLANKADAQLSSRSYEHMLSLPLMFFENVPTGVLVRNLGQAESVRSFLTGSLFHTALNFATMPFVLVSLSLFSLKLTLVVLAFSAIIATIIGLLVPVYKQKIDELYQAEGRRQGDLMETIMNIRAVKSLAIEGQRQKLLTRRVTEAIKYRLSVFNFSNPAITAIGVLQKLMTITILCIGVSEIFDGSLSVGSMVAFFMLSGQVSGPLLQLAGLLNEYQQVALSMRMLGTVMEHPPERMGQSGGVRPVITGEMDFDDVTFSYEGAPNPALNRISFKIEEGEVIGIVGRSGSGKTTVTRLVQGINMAQSGIIRLSGTDIRHMDLPYLRRSIGVVLQENILFRGTIEDNIRMSKPEATREEIKEAARMAGADEFIDLLPQSYETFVEESATNFSGGQRQRLAIARSLLAQPRLLILDEATSALDPDSEAIIQKNLDSIASGRTMLIVSHRLSSLVLANRILVLERGALIDYAPHSTLLERCDIYRHLWFQQNRHLK